MTQTSYALDLRDLMDGHYGAGNWTQRSGIGAGSDIGPALTDGLRSLRSAFGRGIIEIPPGAWLMTNAPAAADLSGHRIEGVGSQASTIIYNNASGAAFNFSGSGGYTGGGVSGIGLLLESGLGNTSAYGIVMQGNATYQQDQTEFNDIYMTSVGASSFWYDGFHVDGTARSSPQGCRVSEISNLQVFNCRNVAVYLSNAVQFSLVNVGCYTGTGPYANTVMINGGSTHVHGIGVNANLNISSASDVKINNVNYA